MVRVQLIVLEVLEQVAVKLVGARLGHDGDDAAAGAAILGVIGILENLELLDGFHGGHVHDGSAGADVGHAIHKHFVFAATAAVDREAGGAADIEGPQITPTAGFEHARGGPCDLKRVTALGGQVGDQLICDGGIAVGGFRLQGGDI